MIVAVSSSTVRPRAAAPHSPPKNALSAASSSPAASPGHCAAYGAQRCAQSTWHSRGTWPFRPQPGPSSSVQQVAVRAGARAASAVSHQAPRLLGKAGVSSSRALVKAPSQSSRQTAEPVGHVSDGDLRVAEIAALSVSWSSSHAATP